MELVDTLAKAERALGALRLLKRRPPEKRAEFQGIKLRIDRPQGYVQRGVDAGGAPWTRSYKTDYGYLPNTEGGDGDELDAYLGPKSNATNAHWIVQRKADGSFDEFKLMLGFPDRKAAKAMWEAHTPPQYYGGMVTTSMALVKSLAGVHPEGGPCGMLAKASSVDAAMRGWLCDRAIADDALHCADAILKAADCAIDAPTRELFDAKLSAFDRAALEAAKRGESLALAVKRVFGVEPIEKSSWSAAEIDKLPDSAFLYVAPGGSKNGEGKTTPRSLRHFPYRNADGKVDLPHLRDALARIPDASIPEEEKTKLTAHAQRLLGSEDKSGTDKRLAKSVMSFQQLSSELGSALQAAIPSLNDCCPRGPWIADVYDDHAVFELDGRLFSVGYAYLNGTVALAGPPIEVVRTYAPITAIASQKDETSGALAAGGKLGTSQGAPTTTNAKPKEPTPTPGFPVRGDTDDNDDVTMAFNQAFDRYLGKSGAERMKGLTVKFAAATAPQQDAELRYVLGIVLEPDITDAQDDTYDAETIRVAEWDYMANFLNAGLQHRELVNYGVDIVECYCAPCDLTIEGRAIKQGTWLLGWHVRDDGIWGAIKSGQITGFSIGGVAQRTPIGDTQKSSRARAPARSSTPRP